MQERNGNTAKNGFTMSKNEANGPAENGKVSSHLTDADYDRAMAKVKKLKIVTMCMGEMGHWIPLTRLVDSLEEAGHEVVMFTNKFSAEKTTRFARNSGVKARIVYPDDITRDQLIRGKDLTWKWLGQGVCEIIPEFVEAVKAEKPDVIVGDFFSGFAPHVAD